MNKQTMLMLLVDCMQLIMAMVKADPDVVNDRDVQKAVFALKFDINSLEGVYKPEDIK